MPGFKQTVVKLKEHRQSPKISLPFSSGFSHSMDICSSINNPQKALQELKASTHRPWRLRLIAKLKYSLLFTTREIQNQSIL